ncbi:MAG: VOC family protein [Acidimicrobiia bacterium]|nr:VOC family protein [Acidimicrobiia bacterium]
MSTRIAGGGDGNGPAPAMPRVGEQRSGTTRSDLTYSVGTEVRMSMVEGIGGVFLQSLDPGALAAWYREHLAMEFQNDPDSGSFYVVFQTRDVHTSEIRENPVFAIEPATGVLAERDERGFTLNLRVQDLEATMDRLTAAGVDVEDRIVVWEGGKHGWMRDLDGNRVELYEELPLAPDSPYRSG